MRIKLRAVLIGGALLVTGCTTIAPNSQDYPRNKIDLSSLSRGRTILLIASSPASLCSVTATSVLRLNKLSGPHEKMERQWIGGISLNGGIFKSDFQDRRGFIQAYELDPGEYELELRYTGEGLAFGGGRYNKTILRPTIQLSSAEIKYVGTLHSEGCGSIKFRFVDEWQSIKSVFAQHYPDLPVENVTVKVQNPELQE